MKGKRICWTGFLPRCGFYYGWGIKVYGAWLQNFLWFQKETEVNSYKNETLEHYTVLVKQSMLLPIEPDPDFHLKTRSYKMLQQNQQYVLWHIKSKQHYCFNLCRILKSFCRQAYVIILLSLCHNIGNI